MTYSKDVKVTITDEPQFSKVTKVHVTGGSGGGTTPAKKPVTRHFQTTKRADPFNSQRIVFNIDFIREPDDFFIVYFNGVLLDKPDFEVVDDAIGGDYIRIITAFPFDTENALVEGFLLRGFEVLPSIKGEM